MDDGVCDVVCYVVVVWGFGGGQGGRELGNDPVAPQLNIPTEVIPTLITCQLKLYSHASHAN